MYVYCGEWRRLVVLKAYPLLGMGRGLTQKDLTPP